jgi:hypothetical protein
MKRLDTMFLPLSCTLCGRRQRIHRVPSTQRVLSVYLCLMTAPLSPLTCSFNAMSHPQRMRGSSTSMKTRQ